MERLYLAHFGLRQVPFSITPDPRFFFPGAGRGDLIRAIEYSVRHQEGIVVVTGEVGSGKTMLCRTLLDAMPQDLESVYLSNPSLRRREMIAAVLRDLGGTQRPDPLDAVQQALIARHMNGRRVVLVVDEAHVISAEVLEQIRLLSNLETGRHKLLQIVLFGQPELDDVLRDRRLRALRDRVVERFSLRQLERRTTAQYLSFRLGVAGLAGGCPFTQSAICEMWRASGGLVRRINLLADKALLSAFLRGSQRVDRRDVGRAQIDLYGPVRPIHARVGEPAGVLP